MFFHGRDLAGIRYSELEVGRSVHFELIEDPISGPRAAQVQIVSKSARHLSGRLPSTTIPPRRVPDPS